MKRYRLAVCKGPDCTDGGAEDVYKAARDQAPSNCTVQRGGCYGLCHLGPNVVLREDSGKPPDPFSSENFQLLKTPTETYYWHMNRARVAQVIERHVKADQVQPELVGDPEQEEAFKPKG